MNRDYLLKLVFALFSITEEWGEDNLFRLKLRNSSEELLTYYILTVFSNPNDSAQEKLITKQEELIQSLEEARRNKFLKRDDFTFLRKEFKKVVKKAVEGNKKILEKKNVENVKEEKKKENKKENKKEKEVDLKEEKLDLERKPVQKREKTRKEKVNDLNERQKKILQVLKDGDKTQVSDLKEFFPDVSKRTVRRDIDTLLEKDFIIRKGKWNDVYYELS